MTVDRDDLERRLHALAESQVPAPDAEFVVSLEQRLRAVTDVTGGAGRGPAGIRRPLAPGWWMKPALGAAAAVLAVLAILVPVTRDGGAPSRDLATTLASAVDTMVRLPDGRVVPGRPGLELADGTVVTTGDRGRAVVGSFRLGPNQTAIVVDGRLRVLTPTTLGPRVTVPSISLPPVGSSPSTTAPGSPPKESPASTTTVPPRPDQLDIVAFLRERSAFVGWSKYEGKDFYAYVIVRADDPASPGYPPKGSDSPSEIVAVIVERDETAFAEEYPDGVRRRYRVVAIDRKGRELTRSAAAEPRPYDEDATSAG